MKNILLSGLFVILGSAMAIAQSPATPLPNVMLDIQNKAAGGGYQKDTANGTLAGRQTTDLKNYSVTLGVTLRNLDKTPNQVSVEWFFFGRQHQDTHVSKEFLVDSGNRNVSMQAAGTNTFDIESKAVQTYNTATYSNETIPGSSTVSGGPATVSVATKHPAGTRISGWIVRITVNGRLVAVKGSDGNYEDAARNQAKLDELKGGQ